MLWMDIRCGGPGLNIRIEALSSRNLVRMDTPDEENPDDESPDEENSEDTGSESSDSDGANPVDGSLREVAEYLLEHELTLVVAESCTGGLLSAKATALPGSSEWFLGGFVAYQPIAKEEVLGISGEFLEDHDLVSEEVALEMVKRALALTTGEVAISTTGLAGPDGDGSDVPVGRVWIAWGNGDSREYAAQSYQIGTTRAEFREIVCDLAYAGLAQRLRDGW